MFSSHKHSLKFCCKCYIFFGFNLEISVKKENVTFQVIKSLHIQLWNVCCCFLFLFEICCLSFVYSFFYALIIFDIGFFPNVLKFLINNQTKTNYIFWHIYVYTYVCTQVCIGMCGYVGWKDKQTFSNIFDMYINLRGLN